MRPSRGAEQPVCDSTAEPAEDDRWEAVRRVRARTPEWIWPSIDFADLPEPIVMDSPLIEPPRRFRRLHRWFLDQQGDSVELSLDCLSALIDGGLPDGAVTANTAGEWWTNNPTRGQSRAWLNAGFVLDREASASARRSGWAEAMVVFHRQPRRVETRAEMVSRRLFWLAHILRCEGESHTWDFHDRPTGVYLLRSRESGLYKVGVSVNVAKRLRAHTSHGRQVDVVATLDCPHRMCAYLIESVVLNLTESWRVVGGWNPAAGGHSEGWSADGPVPDLAALAHRINADLFP
jgi:hypothetical protein